MYMHAAGVGLDTVAVYAPQGRSRSGGDEGLCRTHRATSVASRSICRKTWCGTPGRVRITVRWRWSPSPAWATSCRN